MDIKPIHGVIAMITNQCNLRCPYCFEHKDEQRMTLDTAKDVLQFIQKAESGQNFTLFGGEPMLEYDSIIVPLVEYSKSLEKPTRFNMTTNGTLITEDKFNWLLDNNVQFMLSVDGGKCTQDASRPMKSGGSSFDAIPIEMILDRKPHQMFRMTLTKDNVSSMFENILYFETIGVKDIGVLPDFFQEWSVESKRALSEQIARFENYVINSYKNNHRPTMFRSYAVAFAEIMRLQNTTERREIASCDVRSQCGMGIRGSCSVDIHGDLYACHHIAPLSRNSEWYIGNVYEGLNEERVTALCEKYDRYSVGNDKCSHCPIDKICNGGCKSNNYMITGNMNIVPEMYCFWVRSITDSAYRIAKSLYDNEKFVEFFKSLRGIR